MTEEKSKLFCVDSCILRIIYLKQINRYKHYYEPLYIVII